MRVTATKKSQLRESFRWPDTLNHLRIRQGTGNMSFYLSRSEKKTGWPNEKKTTTLQEDTGEELLAVQCRWLQNACDAMSMTKQQTRGGGCL